MAQSTAFAKPPTMESPVLNIFVEQRRFHRDILGGGARDSGGTEQACLPAVNDKAPRTIAILHGKKVSHLSGNEVEARKAE